MIKRALIALVLAASAIAVYEVGVDAHLAGTVYTPVYRHIASYDCTGTFAQVPSLAQHPAKFECEALVREFEIVCANPQGKINFGNSGPRLLRQIAGDVLTENDLTDKDKGKATKTMLLPDTVLPEADRICKARNKNWSAVDEFV